ncbi:MAG TPA: ATP-binding protein [Jiangellaceae bacterium]
MRHNMLVRLLGLSLTVAVCSIAATAWLTTRDTTERIRGEFDRTLEADGFVYRELLAYATTHDSWTGVAATVSDLADRTGQRVALTTSDGDVIADSAASGTTSPELPVSPAAEIDATNPQASLFGESAVMSSVALAPGWGMTEAELDRREDLAADATVCLQQEVGAGAEIVLDPYGASYVWSSAEAAPGTAPTDEANGGTGAGGASAEGEPAAPPPTTEATVIGSGTKSHPCIPAELSEPSAAATALHQSENSLMAECLDGASLGYTEVETGLGWVAVLPEPTDAAAGDAAVTMCAQTAQTEALEPFVADAAVLYLGSTEQIDAFSGDGAWRTALVGLAVLTVAAGVTVAAGRRFVRPIRALTTAAHQMESGDRTARVPVRGQDDIARLGHAFNAMAESVEAGEKQRRAMVSDVAHELRTPLANVRGYLEAAQDGVVALDPELVVSLLEESRLLQRLVDDLQDLALADAGALRLHPEECDVAELARQVVAAHQTSATEADVTLTIDASAPALAIADAVRLRQAVGNLVGNAVQYTPAGGEVHVNASSDGDHVVVRVEDTGPGIEADQLPHIFDRFYRVDASRSRATGGSGLGLAITKHLVEHHDGSIEVTSVVGEGTAFTIRLPVGVLVSA